MCAQLNILEQVCLPTLKEISFQGKSNLRKPLRARSDLLCQEAVNRQGNRSLVIGDQDDCKLRQMSCLRYMDSADSRGSYM